MNKIKLSVVVPIYNVEQYLKECLESLLGQDFLDFEVILVDNNSTDNSRKIGLKYTKKDQRFKMIECEKQGAAAAKNQGILVAKGEYIWCVDSDDYIEKGGMKKMYEFAKRNQADVATMGVNKIWPDGRKEYLRALAKMGDGVKKGFVMYGYGPWGFLAKRDFLIEHNLFYPEGIIHEDMALISAFVLYTDRIFGLEEPIYFYRQRKGSVLNSAWSKKEFDIFVALEKLLERFEKEKQLKKYHQELEYFAIWNLLSDAYCSFKKAKGMEDEGMGFKKSRDFLRKNFPKWRKNKYLKQKGFRMWIRQQLHYWGI